MDYMFQEIFVSMNKDLMQKSYPFCMDSVGFQ